MVGVKAGMKLLFYILVGAFIAVMFDLLWLWSDNNSIFVLIIKDIVLIAILFVALVKILVKPAQKILLQELPDDDYCFDFSFRFKDSAVPQNYRKLLKLKNEHLAAAEDNIQSIITSVSRLIPMSRAIRDSQTALTQGAVINSKKNEMIYKGVQAISEYNRVVQDDVVKAFKSIEEEKQPYS